MISYHIAAFSSLQHTFNISLSFTATQKRTLIQVPYWRPGRYEGGNFSRNIIDLYATANEKALKTQKTTSHNWEIETRPGDTVLIRYRCYASELTAGNTFLDEDFLLINPVNALVYVLGIEDNPIQLILEIEAKWKVATAMIPAENAVHRNGFWNFQCADLQELLDTPILAAKDLKTLTYREDGIDFYIDIYGSGIDDLENLKTDFADFTKSQLAAFGEFPVNRYHFLILLLPQRAYHGVEHETSTVVIMGPSSELNKRAFYKDLIGVSSHELYHTWNVKSLRPAEWTPYDFTKPNYSRLGYVAEGVTTYMGDWMLWQSRFFSDREFLNELTTHIQRHFDNEGRFNLSLADSSIDTWVDGYGRTAPRRRVSIYVEGALTALICDIKIMKATKGKRGLTHVMQSLYQKFGQKKGFVEADYWNELKAVADLDWEKLKDDLIDRKGNIASYLTKTLPAMGLSLTANASEKLWERDWGISVQNVNGGWEIINVLRNSPSEKAGLWFGDKIINIEGASADSFFAEAQTATLKEFKIEFQSGFKTKTIHLIPDGEIWMRKYKIVQDNDSSQALFKKWKFLLESDIAELTQ